MTGKDDSAFIPAKSRGVCFSEEVKHIFPFKKEEDLKHILEQELLPLEGVFLAIKQSHLDKLKE